MLCVSSKIRGSLFDVVILNDFQGTILLDAVADMLTCGYFE